MKKISLATLAACLLTSSAMAVGPELSLDSRRLLSYGTLAVMTGACKVQLTSEQESRLRKGMSAAADAQKDFTQDEFKELMKDAGTQVGANKESVCAELTPSFVEKSLKDAADGN